MSLPDDWTMDTVHANGTNLQYYRTGNGPPMVLAHGFYDNGRCWEPLTADLGDDYDLIMYDARGHGRSDAPETGYGIEDRVADLVAVVKELDLEDPILMGHSMGGSTVAWTAATHPNLPRAIILEDPAGMHGVPEEFSDPDERAEMVREKVREWTNRSVEDIMTDYENLEPERARLHAVADTECRSEIAEIAREGYPPLVDSFAEITCPTLVLKADADPETRASDLDVADELTRGRLVHIPGAGHGVFRDRYDAAYAELCTFLQRV